MGTEIKPSKFRKKPVVIEAIQLTEEVMLESMVNRTTIFDTLRVVGSRMRDEYTISPYVIIHTLEGQMRAEKGDWIIKGVNGELYPCKPDIFDKTYEPA